MQGLVSKVWVNTTRNGKTIYAPVINGEKLSTFDSAIQAAEGKTIEYEIEVNGTYKNLGKNWSFVNAPGGAATPQAQSVSLGSSGRDESILRQYSFREALQLIKLGIDSGQITMPKTTKKSGISYLRALVKEEARRVFDFVKSGEGWDPPEADGYVPDPEVGGEE